MKNVDYQMIILKLGGSVITRKESAFPIINSKNLDRICREVSEAKPGKLVIVHGAGSFGHPYAKKYEIGHEIKNQEDFRKKKLGYSLTHNSVKELNIRVCHHLLTYGVPAIALPPSSFILTRNKRIESADLSMLENYLEMGWVPVLHGDVVLDMDENIKMAVLSGDQLVKYLAEKLRPGRIILGSDVDGIYNRDPKTDLQAELLPVVKSLEDLESLQGARTVDVTGGMTGKLKELLELAERGIESKIINADQPGLLKKSLKGEKVKGTLISK
jgi:isopentenyl phosphate kinase